MHWRKQDSLMKLGYSLRFHRRAQGLSQIDMAETIGISHRNYQRIESGAAETKLDTLQKISCVLKVSIGSLIRPTNQSNLFIKDLSSNCERTDFSALQNNANITKSDIKFTNDLLTKDKFLPFDPDPSLMAYLDCNNAALTTKLAQDLGLSTANNNLDDYSINCTSAEHWELLFREKIRTARITNFYIFPIGFRAIDSYHPNIQCNPEAPISECFVKDVTYKYQLDQWLRGQLSSDSFIFKA
jgi:transcriptional regulator with XRE-family HTH domain